MADELDNSDLGSTNLGEEFSGSNTLGGDVGGLGGSEDASADSGWGGPSGNDSYDGDIDDRAPGMDDDEGRMDDDEGRVEGAPYEGNEMGWDEDKKPAKGWEDEDNESGANNWDQGGRDDDEMESWKKANGIGVGGNLEDENQGPGRWEEGGLDGSTLKASLRMLQSFFHSQHGLIRCFHLSIRSRLGIDPTILDRPQPRREAGGTEEDRSAPPHRPRLTTPRPPRRPRPPSTLGISTMTKASPRACSWRCWPCSFAWYTARAGAARHPSRETAGAGTRGSSPRTTARGGKRCDIILAAVEICNSRFIVLILILLWGTKRICLG